MKKLIIPILVFTSGLNLFSQSNIENQIFDIGIESIESFREFLSIKNDANYKNEMKPLIEWGINNFQKYGFEVERLETPELPLLLASKVISEDLNTLLIYLQFDGQPVDNSKWDQEDPYKAVLKERINNEYKITDWSRLDNITFDDLKKEDLRIFARSASDAKGPVMMIINALEIMKRNNIELEYNLKVIMDFEEEISSPNLADAVKKYSSKLKSDALLIFDGPKHPSNLPTLTFGARGISDITLITYGPIVPQHSGHFGNYAPNPVFRMSEILSSMKDPNGRVVIPGFYDGIELDEKTLKILAEVPDDEGKMMNDMQFKKPDNVGKNYQESIQYPSINVRGIESGWVREEVRTIVPSECIAEIDVRLVLESDPIRLHNLIKSHIEELGYYVIDRRPTKDERLKHNKIVTFVSSFDYDAFRTDIESEIGKWLIKSLKKTFGIEPVKKRTSGGSVPISPFVNTLGIPAVTVPTVNQDNNQHSPNENIKIENYVTGIETYLGILTDKF
jgi:acetylornithine deacetylase/succinyl-diaminopimelate desuccinylase-like protein|tara:strand:- start:26804 stop:28321 length:1518 start_codon:yes stop_codon:yes gene_type:complete